MLYLLIGYWMLSNKQIFGNAVFPKEYADEVIKTGHSISTLDPSELVPSTLILIVIILLSIFGAGYLLKAFFENFFKARSSQTKELMAVEGLSKFYDSLYKSDLDLWIKEETAMRHAKYAQKLKDYTFGMLILSNIGFLAHRRRHEEKVKQSGLQTVGSYDILA